MKINDYTAGRGPVCLAQREPQSESHRVSDCRPLEADGAGAGQLGGQGELRTDRRGPAGLSAQRAVLGLPGGAGGGQGQ